jgi:hypothetical protein
MRIARAIFFLFALGASMRAEDWLDRTADLLTVSIADGKARARLSGVVDIEGYHIDQPAPGLLFTERRNFFNPRLTLFLDSQIGSHVYAFVQSRLDRGFDPTDGGARMRLDEYALRITPWEDGRFSFQAGKFGTIVGNWVARHGSWDNPFITAPLPYENLTAIWDGSGVEDGDTLLYWAHIHPSQRGESVADYNADKYLRLPIIWGPSYSSGAAVFGAIGKFEYAAEIKNAALSSRPKSWDVTAVNFDYPAFSTRFGWRPNPMWNLGVSGHVGPYLVPDETTYVPEEHRFSEYRELLLAQDISFEWHHLQVWAEFYEARFAIPDVGNADTFAYYVEAKYKFTPQLFGALRWNQQIYSTVPIDDGTRAVWGRDVERIDAVLGYRFSAHTQMKLQYSFQHEDLSPHSCSHTIAAQFTLRF